MYIVQFTQKAKISYFVIKFDFKKGHNSLSLRIIFLNFSNSLLALFRIFISILHFKMKPYIVKIVDEANMHENGGKRAITC